MTERVYRMLMGVALVYDGLVAVLTLGTVTPSTALKLAWQIMQWRIREKEDAQ